MLEESISKTASKKTQPSRNKTQPVTNPTAQLAADHDEDKNAAESHIHTTKGLFDASNLCQPPRLGWKVEWFVCCCFLVYFFSSFCYFKRYIYTHVHSMFKLSNYLTIGIAINRLIVHIMSENHIELVRKLHGDSVTSKLKSEDTTQEKKKKKSADPNRSPFPKAESSSLSVMDLKEQADQERKHDTINMNSTYGDLKFLSSEDMKFLSDCRLRPGRAIHTIAIGDKFMYGHERLWQSTVKQDKHIKPLVMAVFSDFSFGMINLEPGESVWNTKIGKRAEQFVSIQMRDMDILADTNLKQMLQEELKSTLSATIQELREQHKEENEEGSLNEPHVETAAATDSKSKDTKTTTTTTTTAADDSPYMTLVVSSRHFKPHTFISNFVFSLATPFAGFQGDAMAVLNFQLTRRLPPPSRILGSMTDIHIKPLSIYLDPFLVFHIVKFFVGNGVLKAYQMQTQNTYTTSTAVRQRFANRYQIDSIKIVIPLNESSKVTTEIHGLRASSHDKLDESVQFRGLVDLCNLSSFGKQSLKALGLNEEFIERMQKEKDTYMKNQIAKGFLASHEQKLLDNSPTSFSFFRAQDVYPWEFHISHLQFASQLTLGDLKFFKEGELLQLPLPALYNKLKGELQKHQEEKAQEAANDSKQTTPKPKTDEFSKSKFAKEQPQAADRSLPQKTKSSNPTPHENSVSYSEDESTWSPKATTPLLSHTKPDTNITSDSNNDAEFRMTVYSHLDKASFKLTRDGIPYLDGKSVGQQALVQYWMGKATKMQIHLFGKQFNLDTSPFGRWYKKDVVMRFSRVWIYFFLFFFYFAINVQTQKKKKKDNSGHMWSEILNDQHEDVLELSYPHSYSHIVGIAYIVCLF
ncbi:hypothetical protein RFI_16169 [Reticulomyxa filosa]|uniref:Uncharacterized protein n=1 Tax=Reticulomyxa filosa TaxID=46433 RepID=X6N426_RETFI|nr:hypothetical protein RFI_16169 [Reticulomyxa filosa]|eukprot:ETO21035.1 hypothetical protein RFI_16169 [Reticulomyxa filosa]